MRDTFMCEQFFRAIYLRTKEKLAFTCASRARDKYTMVCICFSWALSCASSDLGGARTGGQLSGVSNSQVRHFAALQRAAAPLTTQKLQRKDNERKSVRFEEASAFFVSLLSQALNTPFRPLSRNKALWHRPENGCFEGKELHFFFFFPT